MQNLTPSDMEFLNRAEKVTSFNLQPKDFETNDNKNAIQWLFKSHFFPKFNLDKTGDGIDMNRLNKLIDQLRSENRALLQALHKYPMKGLGPGEILLYFLVKDGYLGGGTSAGVDMTTTSDNKKYEIKACNLSTDKFLFNFKLGGTFNTSDLITEALNLKRDAKAGGEGVNTSAIKEIKKQFPTEWNTLEDKYRDRAYENYFKKHATIFMYNSTSKMGSIITVKNVKKEDIFLDRVTSGIIKPRIKM